MTMRRFSLSRCSHCRSLPSPEASRHRRPAADGSGCVRFDTEKFDRILPEVMRENEIDMWIVMQKEGLRDPLYYDLGEGYVGSVGYYVFTDRGGDRIERAALGVGGRRLEACGVFDIVTGAFRFEGVRRRAGSEAHRLEHVRDSIGAADGLSHTGFEYLVRTLGGDYAERFTSAEKLVSDFRSRRVASEIVAFGEAGEMSREIAERAFSNEVITPGMTTLEEVSWWMQEQLFDRGLESSFGMPSVYVTGPEGIVATSERAHHPARRSIDDRLGRGLSELLHRHEAHRLCAEGGRDGGTPGHPERFRPRLEGARRRDARAIQAGPDRGRDARAR